MKLAITIATIFATLSVALSTNCFQEKCEGALNKCCKKLKPSGQGYTGTCVRKTEDCPAGFEKARRRRF